PHPCRPHHLRRSLAAARPRLSPPHPSRRGPRTPGNQLQVRRPPAAGVENLEGRAGREPERAGGAHPASRPGPSAASGEPGPGADDPELRTHERRGRPGLEPCSGDEALERTRVEEMEMAGKMITAPIAAPEEAGVERIEIRRLEKQMSARAKRPHDE